MSNRVFLLLFVILTLSSGVAVSAAAAGAGETQHGIISGYQFTVWSACVPELMPATTTNGKAALGRDAAVHGGLISHECEAGDGVARPARNSSEGGVPGVAEGAAEAEPSPRDDLHSRARHPPRDAYRRSVARRSSGLNDGGMVSMRPTSSIRESADGETLPRGRGGDLISHTCEAGDGFAWPARNNGKGGVPAVVEHGHAAHLDGARRSSGLNDDGMVDKRSTSTSIRESAHGETLPPRGGGGCGDHPLNIIGDSWRAHPPAVDGSGVVSVPFVLAVDALHLPMHVPTKKSFNRYFPTLLPASGMFAAAAAAGEPEHTADAVFIALVVVTTVQLSRHDQKKKKKKTRRGRTRAAAALLVLLAAVAALPIGAAAARPLRGHAAAAAGVMPKRLASSGRSPCTNDPNTMDAGRPCVHP